MLGRNKAWLLLAVFCAGLFALPALATSFDCKRAANKVERIICKTPELSKLDDQLAAAYKVALTFKDREDFIRRDQRRWVRSRNRCDTAACIKRHYQMQLLVLSLPNPAIDVAFDYVPSKELAAKPPAKPEFILVKGKGVGICDEFQRHLDAHRNPLHAEWDYSKTPALKAPTLTQYYLAGTLYEQIYNLVWARDANPANYVDYTFWRGTKKEYREARYEFFTANSNMVFSRELAKFDIDNDGSPENVLLAQMCNSCDFLMFVLNKKMTGLDYVKTALVLRHPTVAQRGVLRPYNPQEWKLPSSVASEEVTVVRDSLHAADYSLISYKGKNYFYMEWDDPVLNQRAGKLSGMDYRASRLHLFLAEKKQVKEVCTYQYVSP